MAVHVYPFAFSFKDNEGHRAKRIILVSSERTRSKDWIFRIQDNWEGDWITAVNVTKDYGTLLEATVVESKEIPGKGRPYTLQREHVGGLKGYSRITFYWNVLNYALVVAFRETLTRIAEDEIDDHLEKIEKALKAIPSPDQVVPSKRPTAASEFDEWYYAGYDYHFDYLAALEKALKPIGFRWEITSY